MENHITDNNFQVKKSKKARLILIITGLLISILLIWYMVYQSITAAGFASRLNSLNDSLYVARIGQNFAPPRQADFLENLYMLEEKRAFQNAREIMSRSDSVRLTIHLPDSTLRIEIKGLVVHTAKILNFKTSGSLKKWPAMVKSYWLSEPFRAEKNISTILREPIVIKHAPADTIEAQNTPETVPKTETGNVYFTYETGKNLIIHINQSVDGKKKGYLKQKMSRNFRKFIRTARAMLSFKKSEYQQTLELTITKKDAKTVYRALPEFPMITVRL